MAASLSGDTAVLLLGASSAAGRCFLARAVESGLQVLAVSRQQPASSLPGVTWLQQDLSDGPVAAMAGVLVSFGPVGLALRQVQAAPSIGRVVAISSASTVFKTGSPDPSERAQMAQIDDQETRLAAHCAARGAGLSLFKTTMIYGAGNDANVTRLADLSARLPFVPVAGRGLRQPVHAHDLAELALRVLAMDERSCGTWLLGGGEALDYPAMLRRIASAQGRSVRVVRLPCAVLKLALTLAHAFGRLDDVRSAMLERQAIDLVVDDQPARERLGWNPRPFRPEPARVGS
ncbi:MAG: hypothetical protein EA419_12035 [Wenzhouxiangella sp.]|nr:MAG: hypothetical protein EA419_12035 [Wenzhouxiangella sp.]